MNTLPPLATFAADVARELGGEAIALDTGDYPSSVIQLGAHCVLLIRVHVNALVLSLPLAGSWRVRGGEDWIALLPTIRSALAEQRPVISLSDVVSALSLSWTASFPGTPVPEDAALFRGNHVVRLAQQPTSVKISVWEGSIEHAREIATLGALEGLAAWVDEKALLQARAKEAATTRILEEAKSAAALPRPALEDVIAAMQAGQAFQIGGGRSFPTYLVKDGQLVVIHSDDGMTEERPCDEAALADAIAEAPNVFREVLAQRSR